MQLLLDSRPRALMVACLLIASVAVVDWCLDVDISFGFLYLLPMLLVGGHLTRWQIAGVAALCTVLDEAFDPFPWTFALGVSRAILAFAAFIAAGLVVHEAARRRLEAGRHVEELEREAELRRVADQQLDFLIHSSPATIFTLGADGRVLLANEAAHRLLGVEAGSLPGRDIAQYLPALGRISLKEAVPALRTSVECRGRRSDGETFLAQVWFSTYQTGSGPRLAAIVFDVSEDLRDREELTNQQLLSGSKILVGAMCHEIRNMCGAIAAVHAKLIREGTMSGNEDFRALGSLVEGLEDMAALELLQTKRREAEAVDIVALLEELRIVIEPAFRDAQITIDWDVSGAAPAVWADRQALLQSFLNLTKNSQRALEGRASKRMIIRTAVEGETVVVRFIDNGPGVSDPEHLFKPFQHGAKATGLGLYLARAFVRAFHGDIRHEPQPSGCCFSVVLNASPQADSSGWKGASCADSTTVAG